MRKSVTSSTQRRHDSIMEKRTETKSSSDCKEMFDRPPSDEKIKEQLKGTVALSLHDRQRQGCKEREKTG